MNTNNEFYTEIESTDENLNTSFPTDKAKEILGEENYTMMKEMYGEEFDKTLENYMNAAREVMRQKMENNKRLDEFLYKDYGVHIPKGLKEFDYNGIKIYAINKKNADKKYSKMNIIN